MTDLNRNKLPNQIFLTAVGFETSLLFHKDFDEPYFTFFPLLRAAKGHAAMMALAAAFPNSRFTGIDLCDDAISETHRLPHDQINTYFLAQH